MRQLPFISLLAIVGPVSMWWLPWIGLFSENVTAWSCTNTPRRIQPQQQRQRLRVSSALRLRHETREDDHDGPKVPLPRQPDRRGFLASSTGWVVAGVTMAAGTSSGGTPTTGADAGGWSPPAAHAAVTDETDTYANNWWTQPPSGSTSDARATSSPIPTTTTQPASDEITVQFTQADWNQAGGLGLELSDIEFRTNRRVFVKSIRPGSLADRLGIQKDWIVVSLNGQSTERTNAQGVSRMLQTELSQQDNDKATIALVFRDPYVFRQQLETLGTTGDSVTTQVAPAGDTSQRRLDGSLRPGRTETSQTDQKLTVEQLVAPRLCRRGATTDDLLEISYLGTVVETGQVFDGSAVKINGQAIPGRGDDVTLFFVLGKQPFGQFPPGWDVGLYGMCVGERRRLILPPVLAYGATGLPRRGIPPNATLQYDITLVSLNGLATPQ